LVRLKSPESNERAWQQQNGNLQITELVSVAMDTRTGKILGSAEDKGTALQAGEGREAWKDVDLPGGGLVQIDSSANPSVYYFSTPELERITKFTDNGQDNEFFTVGVADAGEFSNPTLK